MRKLFAFITILSVLASCKKQEVTLSTEEIQRQDSLALHVAVMPVLSCLPVYYAERMGLTDSLGVDVRLLRYQAQMDVDTAIERHHTDIAFTDLIRAIRLSRSATPVSPFLATDEPLSLIAIKGKRVKKLNQMKEKMVAICRFSATDFWCDRMLDSARIADDLIYRPQVNDVQLRSNMLRTGLMEGAMVPEPYATWLTMNGNRRLYSTSGKKPVLGVWVIADSLKEDDSRTTQVQKFISACQLAVERINMGLAQDTLRAILMQEYGMPAEVVDSLKMPALRKAFLPREEDVSTAARWLQGRGRLPRKFNTSTFIWRKFELQ